MAGYFPTIRELVEQGGWKTTSKAHELLCHLASRGIIEQPAERRYRLCGVTIILPEA